MTKAEQIAKTKKNILTIQDLGVIWGISNRKRVLEGIKYNLKKGRLIQIQRGIYSKSKDYESLELAQKIIPLSYISLYTALAKHGVIFQYYETIHSIALKSRKIQVENQNFTYHQVKPEIFFNNFGIAKKQGYLIATRERAICDSLYLKPTLAFDNLAKINSQRLLEISKIYHNKRLEKDINKLIKLKNARANPT
jgi:predicted transcriptional regulator of viral defense system